MSARTWNVLATIAFAYVLVMALGGGQMKQAQFVAFEAKGLLAEDPAGVSAVSLGNGQATVTLARGATGWTRDGKALAAALLPRVEMAVKFLHTAEPVRRMTGADMAATADSDLGFDANALTVTARLGEARSLAVRFGRQTPEGSLQYLRVAGDDHVYLMSRFVGEEWEAVWSGLQ